jgi:hypothetical protein
MALHEAAILVEYFKVLQDGKNKPNHFKSGPSHDGTIRESKDNEEDMVNVKKRLSIIFKLNEVV